MEELIVRLLENSIALAAFGFAWRLAEMRYEQERKLNESLQDRYLTHFEEEHPTRKAGD